MIDMITSCNGKDVPFEIYPSLKPPKYSVWWLQILLQSYDHFALSSFLLLVNKVNN